MGKMSCWEVLGLEKTGDREAIREAYLKKLPGVHPEEDPKGFQLLRSAMEEAMREASDMEREEEPEGVKETDMMDSREIRLFLRQVQEVYRDYEKRIMPEQWKELLSLGVCQDLETQKEAGWALIGFLIKHFHIPHSCFVVMDQVFGWTEAREELSEHFPEGFVRYLMDRIEEEDSFRYDKTPLRDDFDYDAFFEAYFELRTAIGEKDRDRVEKALDVAEAMGVEHPDLTILKISHLSMIRGMEEQVWEMARQLYETDGENKGSRYWYVRAALDLPEMPAEAEDLEGIVAGLVEEDPKNPGFWQIGGAFLRKQERLEEALQAFRRAYEYSDGWEYLQKEMEEAADALSRQMEEQGVEDVWVLASVCWTGNRYDKVRQLLEEYEPEEERFMAWLMLMAGSCHGLEDFEAALSYREKIWDGYKPEERPLRLYMDLAEEYGLVGNRAKALEIYGLAADTFTENGEIYFRQAKLLEEDGKKREAARMCEKALAVEFHGDAFGLWMELLLDLEEYEQARERAKQVIDQGYRPASVVFYYAKALRCLEEFDDAKQVLGELYDRTDGADVVCEEYSSLFYDMDEPGEALKWIQEAIEKRCTPRRLYMKADCLRDLDRFQEELDVYARLEQDGFESYFMDYRIGRALENLDLFEEAEQRFKASIGKQADYGLAWDGLGDVLQKQGKWDQAVTAYEGGMELGHLQASRDLCRLLKRLHRNDEAVSRLEEGLKKWPEDGSLLLLYSDVLVRIKEFDKAVKCLNRYMEAKPSQTGRAYREIAMTYERAKDFDKAEEFYQKSVDHEPKNARAWRLMGKFLANEKKDMERALIYLEKAAELAPDSTYGFMKLGETYEALGRKDEAFACYEKSLANYQKDVEEDPKDCCNYEGMADVLAHLGRHKEAEEMAKKAIALQERVFTCSCPFCYEAYEDLAKIQEQKGELEKALEFMEMAGRLAVTEHYPGEIKRLKEAIKTRDADKQRPESQN